MGLPYPIQAHRLLIWPIALSLLGAATWGALQIAAAMYRPVFRDLSQLRYPIPSTNKMRNAVPLIATTKIQQRFVSGQNDLNGLKVQVVTWDSQPQSYPCRWSIWEVANNSAGRKPIRSGQFDPEKSEDWGLISLNFEPISNAAGKQFEVQFEAPQAPPVPEGQIGFAGFVGLPVYETSRESDAYRFRSINQDHSPAQSGGCLRMYLLYDE